MVIRILTSFKYIKKCSTQTFGDMIGNIPHLHILCADCCFSDNGSFYTAAADLDATTFEPLFRQKILSMLKRKGLIGECVRV